MIQFSAGFVLLSVHPCVSERLRLNALPGPLNRKNHHQTGLFLIPPEDAQVNPNYPHQACRSSLEMQSLGGPVARR